MRRVSEVRVHGCTLCQSILSSLRPFGGQKHQGGTFTVQCALVLGTMAGKSVVWVDAVWSEKQGLPAGDQVGGNEQNEAITGESPGVTRRPAFHFVPGNSKIKIIKKTKASPTGFPNLFCMNWRGCFEQHLKCDKVNEIVMVSEGNK